MESGNKLKNNTVKKLINIHNNHKHEWKINKIVQREEKKIRKKTIWEGKEKENRKVEKRGGK